jgi:hypothetical protein
MILRCRELSSRQAEVTCNGAPGVNRAIERPPVEIQIVPARHGSTATAAAFAKRKPGRVISPHVPPLSAET